jgi:hypothetical protein
MAFFYAKSRGRCWEFHLLWREDIFWESLPLKPENMAEEFNERLFPYFIRRKLSFQFGEPMNSYLTALTSDPDNLAGIQQLLNHRLTMHIKSALKVQTSFLL